MKYVVVSVLLSCLWTLASARSIIEAKFKQVESLKNKISDHSQIIRYDEVRSKVSCARECSNDDHCSLFFFKKSQRFCSLHSEDNIRLDQTTDVEGAMFFKLTSKGDWTSKGYTFSETAWVWYKGYRQPINWTSAAEVCERDGAALISPITKQKRELVDAIRKTLLRGGLIPWVGCRKERRKWVWMDGTAVGKKHWRPGHPESNKNCCHQYNRRLASMRCDLNKTFVCEIPP